MSKQLKYNLAAQSISETIIATPEKGYYEDYKAVLNLLESQLRESQGELEQAQSTKADNDRMRAMQLERHINKLPEIYARINKLEEFVTVVETNIDQLSRSIRDAQDTFDLTLPNRLEQLVLLTTKSSRPMFRIWTDPDYEPPEVFNAEDYLPNISIPLIDDEGSAESRPAAS